jgi:hypothetical protein
MEVIDNGPKEHHGSYDAVDHGYDSRQQSPFARGVSEHALSQYYDGPVLPYENDTAAVRHGYGVQLPPNPFGQFPQLPQLPGGGVQPPPPYQTQGLIKVVPQGSRPAVMASLAFMTPPANPAGVQGTTQYTASPQPMPAAWAEGFIGSGYTILIDVVTPPQPGGARQLAVVAPGAAAPDEVRALAGAAGKFAVVDGPFPVLAAAQVCPPGSAPNAQGICQLISGVEDCPPGMIPGAHPGSCVPAGPPGPCPAGTAPGADGGCLPVPNGPPPPPTEKPPVPWMAVAGVAGGLVVVALIARAVMSDKGGAR